MDFSVRGDLFADPGFLCKLHKKFPKTLPPFVHIAQMLENACFRQNAQKTFLFLYILPIVIYVIM